MSRTEVSTIGESRVRTPRRVRVHIEVDRRLYPVFMITPEAYQAALERHPDVAPYLETSIGYDFETWDEAMASAEVLIGYRFPTEGVSRYAPNLRWIQVIAAGVDHLCPLDWLPAGVALTTNSGAHVPKAAQSASMAILMVNSELPFLVTSQRRHQWNRKFTPTVEGRTLAIVGVGRIGGGVAEEAKHLKMHVLGVRRTGQPHPFVDEMYRPEELGRVLPRADIVIVTAAFTSTTRHLMGPKEFRLMKPGAAFINMARGGLVDYEALAERLTTGALSGAVVDVTAPEPLPADSPLWDTPNLIITPHVMSDDLDRYVPRTLDVFMANVRRYVAGDPLMNRVDVTLEY